MEKENKPGVPNHDADDGKQFVYEELIKENRELKKRVQELTAQVNDSNVLIREYLEHVFQEAPFAICLLQGPELVFQFTNRMHQQIFPGSQERIGKPFVEAVPELMNSLIPALMEKVYQTGETFTNHEQQSKVARSPGMPLEDGYFNVTYQAIRNTRGEIDGILIFVYEVTEHVLARKTLEKDVSQANTLTQELSSANQDLARTNTDLDTFIYTASHDLKAPIHNLEGLIAALVQTVPQGNRSAPFSKILGMIGSSINRFKHTLEDLTSTAKLQEETQDESMVSLSKVVEGVQLDIAMEIEKAQAKLEVDVEECGFIPFSAKNLRSIIYNLVSNAIKYRSPERLPIVKLHCRQEEEYLVLTVQDNGLGIHEDKLHKLFQRYQRLHHHVDGTGIGLFMIRRIIENSGGRIEVHSQEGKGTTFIVYFRKNLG